jgi:hypothetical protein
MVSDLCHNGGLIDNEKEQIGPSVNNLAAGILTLPALCKNNRIGRRTGGSP